MKAVVLAHVQPGLGSDALVENSVRAAWSADPGPFRSLDIVSVQRGEGASGLAKAAASGADWILVLDEGSRCHETSFSSVQAAIDRRLDALWGFIVETGPTGPAVTVPQNPVIEIPDEIALVRPAETIRPDYWIRSAAVLLPDPAEGFFAYAMRLWTSLRCAKAGVIIAVRSPSSGIEATSSWEASALLDVDTYRRDWFPVSPSQREAEIRNRHAANLSVLLHTLGTTPSPDDVAALSARYPYRGLVTVGCYHGSPFCLRSDGHDDDASSFFWRHRSQEASTGLWLALVRSLPPGTVVADASAGSGLFALIASRARVDISVSAREFRTVHAAALLHNVEESRAERILVSTEDRDALGWLASLDRTPAIIRISLADLRGRSLEELLSTAAGADVLVDASGGSLPGDSPNVITLAGYRCFAMDEETGAIEACPAIPASSSLRDRNRLLTRRDDAALAAVLA